MNFDAGGTAQNRRLEQSVPINRRDGSAMPRSEARLDAAAPGNVADEFAGMDKDGLEAIGARMEASLATISRADEFGIAEFENTMRAVTSSKTIRSDEVHRP